MNSTKHAVLTSEGVFHAWDTHYATLEMENVSAFTLEDVMYVALHEKLTHLWVHPSAGLAFTKEQAQCLLDPAMWDVKNGELISVQKNGEWAGYVTSVTGRLLKPYKTQNTRLLFVQQGNWPLDNATPEQILRVADKVENKLDVVMAGSPTTVGLRYLEKKNTRYREHYFEKSDDVDWEALRTAHIAPIRWFPALVVPDGELYVHCFDRNSSHPYAASQENMGVGTPYIQDGGEFDKNKVGLWDVEFDGGQVSPALPPLISRGRVWFPTPLLRIATQYGGYTVTVNQAILWPEGKPVFERWAKELWGFREQFPRESMEREAVKSIMNMTVGGTKQGGKDNEMDATFRPDWYATIIGAERAIVWYKAWSVAKQSGVYPIGCYSDALYYLSPNADPEQAAPGIIRTLKNGKKTSESLGGYKHVWTLPVDDNVRAVLAATTLGKAKINPALRIGELKKLVGAK